MQSNIKVAITGHKWINNTSGFGGYSAIDLVMHLDSLSLHDAAAKLESIDPNSIISTTQIIVSTNEDSQNFVPEPCENTWNSVKRYLCNNRLIPEYLIDELHANSLLWSDKMRNCVFPRDLGTGAFLRGTLADKPFKMTIGNNGRPYVIPGDNLVIITEAPIDAISLKYYNSTATVLATGGRIGFDKVNPYLSKAYMVLLAHDNDRAGNQQANNLAKNIACRVIRFRRVGQRYTVIFSSSCLLKISMAHIVVPKLSPSVF